MKAQEMLTKKPAELNKDLTTKHSKLIELTAELRIKDVKNVRQIRVLKKDIARINTVINSQRLEASK